MRQTLLRHLLSCSASIALLCSGAGPVRAGMIANVSTGLDASNNVLTSGGLSDAHWTVSELAGGFGAPQSVFPGNADYFGGWVPNGPGSDWVARKANVASNGPAPYTFSTTFDLTGVNLATVSLIGSWAIDDTGSLNLNGTQIGFLTAGWATLTSFAVAPGSGLFVQGMNTLSITITDTDNYLEGVRLQGSVTTNAVPEPATVISTTIGGLIALGFGRRARRKAAR